MALIKTHDLRKKRVKRQDEEESEQRTDDVSEGPGVNSTVAKDLQKTSDTQKQTTSRSVRSQERPKTTGRHTRSRQPKKPTDTKRRATTQRPQTRRPRQRQTTPKRSAPVIGIPCSFEHLPDRKHHSQQYFYLYRPYVSAIHDAGGVPIIIPVGLEARYSRKVLEIIDGLLLAGAVPDIDPNRYGDPPQAKLGRVDPREDRTEIELFNLAFNKNLPILGLCRGIQVINVALDGTLYQDIGSQVRMSLNHDPKFPPTEVCHAVHVEEGSKLHKVLGETEMWVNSTHHQAVKLHGKSLVVSARASDGVTEGIEHPTKKWIIGVQWHPELLYRKDKIQANLFNAFIEVCKN